MSNDMKMTFLRSFTTTVLLLIKYALSQHFSVGLIYDVGTEWFLVSTMNQKHTYSFILILFAKFILRRHLMQ